MNTTQRIVTGIGGVLALTVPAAPAFASNTSPTSAHVAVAGDEPGAYAAPTLACDTDYFTACSGGVDVPYSGVETPNSCIERNGGDFNACNVGNSGRGDLPYRTPSR